MDRIGAAIEQEFGGFYLVLAHGKVHWRAINMMAAHQRGVLRQQAANGFQVARDGGAEHLPDLDAGPGGPLQGFVLLELFGPDHLTSRRCPCASSGSPTNRCETRRPR